MVPIKKKFLNLKKEISKIKEGDWRSETSGKEPWAEAAHQHCDQASICDKPQCGRHAPRDPASGGVVACIHQSMEAMV